MVVSRASMYIPSSLSSPNLGDRKCGNPSGGGGVLNMGRGRKSGRKGIKGKKEIQNGDFKIGIVVGLPEKNTVNTVVLLTQKNTQTLLHNVRNIFIDPVFSWRSPVNAQVSKKALASVARMATCYHQKNSGAPWSIRNTMQQSAEGYILPEG